MIRIVAAALLAAAPATAALPTADPVLGVWANPKNTLARCGAIVRAEPEARADAREAGVPRLIGVELLQGYHPIGRNSWAGRVYVPDMHRSFSSRIRQTAPDRLTISGCLVGGLFCRSQQWHRVP